MPLLSDLNPEELARVEAVKRALQGEPHPTIWASLQRGKTWFYKWWTRSQAGDPEWYKDHSRRPHTTPQSLDPKLEHVVLQLRREQMDHAHSDTRFLGVGADVIQYRMHLLDFPPKQVPSLATIKRIIKRHGLLVNKKRRPKRVESRKAYTLLHPTRIHEVHQMDFVGPRFISGYGPVNSLDLVDVASFHAWLQVYQHRSMDNVLSFLQDHWLHNPLPSYLQVDNAMSFAGDVRLHPGSFSRFVRLCLRVGVEVVFIAPGKAWMNGSVESFNSNFEDWFWSKQRFANLRDMRQHKTEFQRQHNAYVAWKNRDRNLTSVPPRRLARRLDANKLPLTAGRVHFIRQVDEVGAVEVLGSFVEVGQEFIGDYVWATVDVGKRELMVLHRAKGHEAHRVVLHQAFAVNGPVERVNPRLWTVS